MKLPRFCLCMVFFTALALIYIHLQVQIFDLAYQGKERQQEIQQLSDDNSDVLYNIYALKSASHLGSRMLAENSDMKFREKTEIVEVAAPVSTGRGDIIALSRQPRRSLGFLSNLFTLGAQAEARTTK